MLRWSFLPTLVALLFGGCASVPPPRTVEAVDLKRYTGEWHEVARYPNWFQPRDSRHVTATYRPNADGSIAVLNSCIDANGKPKTARGRATVVPNTGNSKLKVSFGGPFAGDYWILALDRDYQWALVGHPSRNFLWILSRTPRLSPERYAEIVQLAVDQGYDAARIQPTPP